MLDSATDLRRTARSVRTIPSRFALILNQLASANRAGLDEFHWFCARLTLVQVHTDDFRDDFAAFHHGDGIAIMQIELADEVLII